MKKLFPALIIAIFLVSCQTAQKPLYSWGKYENSSYSYLKKNNDKATLALMDDYKKIIGKQEGTRKIPPPGIYADYGFLLMQAGKSEEGKAMLEKEIAIYPEAKIFIDRILLMFSENAEAKKEDKKEEVNQQAQEAKKVVVKKKK